MLFLLMLKALSAILTRQGNHNVLPKTSCFTVSLRRTPGMSPGMFWISTPPQRIPIRKRIASRMYMMRGGNVHGKFLPVLRLFF